MSGALLQQIDNPLQIYKTEKQQVEAVREETEKTYQKTKKVVWWFWIALALVNGSIIIGSYYQDKIIRRTERRLKMESMLLNNQS